MAVAAGVVEVLGEGRRRSRPRVQATIASGTNANPGPARRQGEVEDQVLAMPQPFRVASDPLPPRLPEGDRAARRGKLARRRSRSRRGVITIARPAGDSRCRPAAGRSRPRRRAPDRSPGGDEPLEPVGLGPVPGVGDRDHADSGPGYRDVAPAELGAGASIRRIRGSAACTASIAAIVPSVDPPSHEDDLIGWPASAAARLSSQPPIEPASLNRVAQRLTMAQKGRVSATSARRGAALSRSDRSGSSTLVEQRQVEQPFAGVIDDIEGQRAIRAILPLVVDDQPQLADVGGRVPARAVPRSGCGRGFRRRSAAPHRRAAAPAGRGRSVPWRRARTPENRPPRVRPWISAVMNTVLPARDKPVTPRRTVGLNRLSP